MNKKGKQMQLQQLFPTHPSVYPKLLSFPPLLKVLSPLNHSGSQTNSQMHILKTFLESLLLILGSTKVKQCEVTAPAMLAVKGDLFLLCKVGTQCIFPEKHCQKWCLCSDAQSCLTLCNPMDCSLPGSSVYGISQ